MANVRLGLLLNWLNHKGIVVIVVAVLLIAAVAYRPVGVVVVPLLKRILVSLFQAWSGSCYCAWSGCSVAGEIANFAKRRVTAAAAAWRPILLLLFLLLFILGRRQVQLLFVWSIMLRLRVQVAVVVSSVLSGGNLKTVHHVLGRCVLGGLFSGKETGWWHFISAAGHTTLQRGQLVCSRCGEVFGVCRANSLTG